MSDATPSDTQLKPLSQWISAMPYHVGIEVPDLNEGLAFYRDLLGFEEAWRTFVDAPFLGDLMGIPGLSVTAVQLIVPGGSRIELMEYKPQGKIGGHAANNQGLNHLSFGVTDVQAAYDSLTAAGIEFTTEPIVLEGDPTFPANGYTVAYFADPWGTSLEILAPTTSESVADTGEVPA